MTFCGHMFLCHFSWINPKMGFLSHKVVRYLLLLKWPVSLQKVCTTLCSLCMRVLVSSHLGEYFALSVFQILVILVDVEVLICVFLITNDIALLCVVLLAIYISFLRNLFKYFCFFTNWVFFILLIYSSLWIQNTSSSMGVCVVSFFF